MEHSDCRINDSLSPAALVHLQCHIPSARLNLALRDVSFGLPGFRLPFDVLVRLVLRTVKLGQYRPRIPRKIAYLKPSFMVPAWVMIIYWAYLELLVITRTDKLQLVPSNCLFCGWMCLHSRVTRLNLIVFFSHEKKSLQMLESLASKWNTLE